MAEWLFNHLVPVLVVLVVIIYITAWRTLAPRKADERESLRDCVKFGPETDISGYAESAGPCFWRDAHDGTPINYGGFPGTSAADFNISPIKEFVIPHRDTYPHERVKTVEQYDAESSLETNECCATSYTELMGRLRTGTLQPADMPSTLPVTFEMLLSLVMAMIDTHERKGDAKVCDDVYVLLRRRYDSTSLNHVPEARYLELWVDLKQLGRSRG